MAPRRTATTLVHDALAPLREALLRSAHEDAEQILARADEQAEQVVAQAQAQAERIRAAARARGAADSAGLVAAERSRAGRQARAVVLEAQRAEHEALRDAARAAVATVRDEPDYAALRRRMAAVLRGLLGDDAAVLDAPGGGVTATVRGRAADFSLARLADRAVDTVLAEESDVDSSIGAWGAGMTSEPAGSAGRSPVVRRVNGPLVETDRTAGLAMSELLEIGRHGIPAEVVSLDGDLATAQAYEYTGSVAVGDPVRALGRPLSARLGPGLTGRIYDGLLRPLDGAGTWLEPEAIHRIEPREWIFTPVGEAGRRVGAGEVLGTVAGAGPVEHRVLVPPGLSGRLEELRPAGRYGEDEPVAVVAGTPVTLALWWPVRRARPSLGRAEAAGPLLTGQRVIDAVYPVPKGGAAAVPGGFGTGKTMLLQQIAKWCDADVIVYVGCGERGNEMADVVSELAKLTDPRTGGRLADRTVLVANTSNMPIMAREASIYTGVTVAEYYRDMGYDVVVIADSTSRWAEALREFASRTGAMPAEEGYPATLASALAAFYERSGRVRTLGGREGSVTIIGAVSPPGGDMTEPVSSHTQRFVRTLWTLDRDLAYSRHYPAVAWVGSYCRDADAIGGWYAANGDEGWSARRGRVVSVLAEADRLASLAELVGVGALPGHERMTMLCGTLLREAVLQQSALSDNDAHCSRDKTAALVDMVFAVVDRCEQLVEDGLPAARVEELDFSTVVRVREETAPDDVDGVRRCLKQTLDMLEDLT